MTESDKDGSYTEQANWWSRTVTDMPEEMATTLADVDQADLLRSEQALMREVSDKVGRVDDKINTLRDEVQEVKLEQVRQGGQLDALTANVNKNQAWYQQPFAQAMIMLVVVGIFTLIAFNYTTITEVAGAAKGVVPGTAD